MTTPSDAANRATTALTAPSGVGRRTTEGFFRR